MSCPWAKITAPEPVNFDEIMSEEVARDLQAKEDRKRVESSLKLTSEVQVLNPDDETCDSDAVIARMLQMQFDREHDENLKRTEDKYNGTSKVSISFDNYRRAPQNTDFESESDEEEVVDIRDRKDWDRFDDVLRQYDSIPACGYKRGVDGTMVTKHDVTMSGVKNACKMLSFPPDFHTGDGEMFDLKLSNKVFNSLKRYSQQEESRRHKIKDKKEAHATVEFGVDQYTRLLMYKIINNEILESVNGVISIGKEAVILHANGNSNREEHPSPAECVIKVFKTTLSEFKQRDKYIKEDERFKDRMSGNKTTRRCIQLWAEKEMHNLNRLKNAGILCPEVVLLKQHVLVMSFIGKDGMPAPKLKHTYLTDEENALMYEQIVAAMKTLFDVANLVHSDLSEYNILWHEGHCYFIDVSQSVLVSHVNAFIFLYRDCNNIVNFFSKQRGLREMHTADELFEIITGFSFGDKMALTKIQESFKMKPHLVDRPGFESTYNFEEAWEQTQATNQHISEPSTEPPLA